jgi:predicted secreted protein
MFVNKLKMNSVAEAVKKITENEPVTEAEKVPTATGMKVYGSSYGNSAKARRDQVKKEIDTIKGPKAKDLIQKDKEDYEKTKGRYDEAAKIDGFTKDELRIKKEIAADRLEQKMKNQMKKTVADKKKSGGMNETHEFKSRLIEALKGNQHKIDKNKNNKIDSQDFKILRGEKSVTEASCDDEVKKHEKKMHGKDGEVAKHVDKMHKEEAEQIEEKEMTDAEMAKREKIVKSMKKGFAGFRQRYGKDAKSVMYATATKQAMKEDTVEEEIDPKVRTKDTLKGQEPTAQKDDVGPGSDAKSTKVKFRGGPMKEEVKKSDIPAFIRKARGDKPLTVADAKAGSKDSISSKENLAKARGVQEGKQPESDTVPFVTNADQPPFDGPYTKIGSTVTDKSGAKHTPMSRARDLARQAMKRIKTEMLGKAPGNNG